jgi:hypothetical protein
MTDRTNHVIEAIDSCLEDWSVSGDAMRCVPDPKPGKTPASTTAQDMLATIRE